MSWERLGPVLQAIGVAQAAGEQLDPDKHTKRLVTQLERLGHNVTLTEQAAA